MRLLSAVIVECDSSPFRAVDVLLGVLLKDLRF